MSLQDVTIATVGTGVMAELMITGLLKAREVDVAHVIASHPRGERREHLARTHGIRTTESNQAAVAGADIVVLGIKPQMIKRVGAELAQVLRPEQLVISVIAGATTGALTNVLHHRAVVRSMPNTPAQLGRGMTVWYATPEVTVEQREHAAALLRSLGAQIEVEDEKFVAMATAVSGTGPAYVFLVMEALIDAAVHLGFPRHIAHDLVIETLEGSTLFAKASGMHPAQLRNMVTSPGGTSAAAIHEASNEDVCGPCCRKRSGPRIAARTSWVTNWKPRQRTRQVSRRGPITPTEATRTTRRTDGWLWLALLFAVTGFVESMSFGHYLSFLPLLVRDLGVPPGDVAATVGLLSAAALLAGLPLVPFWGAWADRYSRKVIIVRSAVVEALLFVLLAFVTDVAQLFLLVPMVGLVLGNTGVMLAETTDRAPRARLGFAISIVGAAGPLGLAVGPAIGGPIVDHFGLQTLFLVDAMITGVIVLALILGYHEAADRIRSILPVMTLVRRSLIAVLRTPLAQGVFVTYFLVLLGQRLVSPFLALYVESINGPVLLASTVGLVAGAYGLAATIGSPLAGALADRVGFGRVLLGSIALASAAALVAPLLRSLVPFGIDYAVLGVGFATAGSMLFATLATGLPHDIRSSVLNLSLVPAYLSGIIGSLLAVQVVERTDGDLRPLWIVGGVIVAVALVPAWRLEALVRRRATLSA